MAAAVVLTVKQQSGRFHGSDAAERRTFPQFPGLLKSTGFHLFFGKGNAMITGGYHRNTVGNDPITDCGSEAVTFSRGSRSQISSVAGANHSQTAGIDLRAGIQSSVQETDKTVAVIVSQVSVQHGKIFAIAHAAGQVGKQHNIAVLGKQLHTKVVHFTKCLLRTIMKKYNRRASLFLCFFPKSPALNTMAGNFHHRVKRKRVITV